jgi:hypothetical protein
MGDEDDNANGASAALLVPPVRTPRLRIAGSLADAAPGDMLYVNRRGQTLTTRQVTVVKVTTWTILLAGGPVMGLLYGAVLSPLAGLAAGAAVGLALLFNLRHWPALQAALAQFAAYQWEEARTALLALERKRMPPSQRQSVQVALASIDVQLGQPQRALDRLERVQPALSARGSARVLRCYSAGTRAVAFAMLGRFDQARRARDELVREVAAATGTGARPRGDYFELLVDATELRIAAEADTPDALPDDDTLHRWARAALGRTTMGEMLVGLAWAVHRRGDDDMARHLLAEAPSRIPRWSLHVTSPRLDAWAKESARAWGIEDPILNPRPA